MTRPDMATLVHPVRSRHLNDVLTADEVRRTVVEAAVMCVLNAHASTMDELVAASSGTPDEIGWSLSTLPKPYPGHKGDVYFIPQNRRHRS